MLLRYLGPFDVVEIGGTDFHSDLGKKCRKDGTPPVLDFDGSEIPDKVEVADDLGVRLLEQPSNWQPVASGKPNKVKPEEAAPDA